MVQISIQDTTKESKVRIKLSVSLRELNQNCEQIVFPSADLLWDQQPCVGGRLYLLYSGSSQTRHWSSSKSSSVITEHTNEYYTSVYYTVCFCPLYLNHISSCFYPYSAPYALVFFQSGERWWPPATSGQPDHPSDASPGVPWTHLGPVVSVDQFCRSHLHQNCASGLYLTQRLGLLVHAHMCQGLQ